MARSFGSEERFRGIAFIGNYLPRKCGIATFTHDLAEAVAERAGPDQPVIVAAMNDLAEGYIYPDRVKLELRQDYQVDYSRAADFLNFSRVDVVCLQHEFGIFGGKWGVHVLSLLRDLHRPTVVTCHTVQKEPAPIQLKVFREIADLADRLVVMSNRALEFLQDVYHVDRDKVVVIPHGIHDVPFIDPSYYKDKFGVEGRKVLLTFGLLHRNKGIEYMIEALPAIVERHPRVTYVVLGATHPNVVREEGEFYRLRLQRRVRDLGLEDHVLFHPRFVELDELLEYLGASDVFVTPYLQLDQITSGALAYAVGCGKAVVSTAFWHAEELLADGRGRIVPVGDSAALASEINSLLDDEVATVSMRKRAYAHSRSMVWSAVAQAYLELFDEVRCHGPRTVPTASAMSRPIAATNLPLPKLDHLQRLSDSTGPCHHARRTVPDWAYGYQLEDAALVLVVTAKFHDIYGDRNALRLAEICLSLIQTIIGDTTRIAAGLDYTRRRVGTASETAIGKILWALGYVLWRGPSLLEAPAYELFHQVLPAADVAEPKGAAYTLLGAYNYLRRFPGASELRRFFVRQLGEIDSCCSDASWKERFGGADWPVAVQALTVAGRILDDDELRARARECLGEVRRVTAEGSLFLRLDDAEVEEELPTTAAAFIEALGAAFYDRRDEELLGPIRSATDWFLGANRIGESLYDFATGGCHDALTGAGLNLNQGVEATAFCLLAFLTLHRMAGLDTSVSS